MFNASRIAVCLASAAALLACGIGLAAETVEEPDREVRHYPVAEALAGLTAHETGEDPLAALRKISIVAGASTDVLARRVSAEGDWRLELTATQHAAFVDLLEGLRRGGSQQVVLTAWWLDLESLETLDHINLKAAVRFPKTDAFSTPEAMTTVDGDTEATSTVTTYEPYLAAVLREEQSVELLDRVQRHARTNLASTPKITFWNGQRGTIQDLSQQPLVLGVEKLVGEFGEVNQPVIAVLSEGRTLGARAVALYEGGVELSLQLTESRLESVEEVGVPGEEVVVQAPRVSSSEISAKRLLRDGESLLLAPSVQPDERTGRFRCCLVSAKAIQPQHVASTTPRTGPALAAR